MIASAISSAGFGPRAACEWSQSTTTPIRVAGS